MNSNLLGNPLAEPIRLVFLVRSLDAGGAERQLTQLVRSIDKRKFEVTVLTFYSGGELWSDISTLPDVTLVSLEKKGRWDLLLFLWRLIRQISMVRPHVIHAYLGVANELALLVGKLTGSKAVWGLRASNMDFSKYDWMHGLTFYLGAVLSRWADLIIVNSVAGKQHYATNNYYERAMVTIPNGINCDKFHPGEDLGRALRKEWRVSESCVLIGMVARLDPMKDHETFLKAAALVAREKENVHFVCVGDGNFAYKQSLVMLAARLDIRERLTWVGSRQDVTAVYNSFDIAVLASKTEGFPNVVGEAMACAIPCIVTDVGDASIIVGTREQVVPLQDAYALANAILRLIQLSDDERKRVGKNGRLHIIENFSLPTMVSRTEKALQSLLA